MKILITGIFGFLAQSYLKYISTDERYIVDGLARKKDSRFNSYGKNINKIYTTNDIEDIEFDYDIILHLAGKNIDNKHVSNYRDYEIDNIILSKNIFNRWYQNKGLSKFIYISTSSVYEYNQSEIEYTEGSKVSPTSIYSKTKLQAEDYLSSHELPENKSLLILRPAPIYGIKSKGNIRLLFNSIEKGVPYPLGKFNNTRSLLSERNFCYLLNACIHKPMKSGVYNISNDDTISTKKIVEIIYYSLGKKPKILNLPKFIVVFASRIGDTFGLKFNSETVVKASRNFILNNTKIKKELNISQLPENMEDSLTSYFKNIHSG